MDGVTFIESFIIFSKLCPSGVSISPSKYSSSSLMLRSVLASPFSLKVLFGKARTLSSISRNLKYFHHCMTLNGLHEQLISYYLGLSVSDTRLQISSI
jgi:hypothetical protein